MNQKRPDAIKYLTGHLCTRDYPSGISLPGQGGKFNTSGEVQTWRGNTFLCHVVRSSPSFSALVELQEQIKRSEFGRLITFLPAPSFHMTVFQGLSPGKQGKDDWPAGLPEDVHRDHATAEMLNRVQNVQLASNYEIRVADLFCASSLTVEGRDDAAEATLRQARELLRETTRISPPDFDTYVFNISLGYLIQWLSESTARELVEFSDSLFGTFESRLQSIELEPCAFCNFENMHAFFPVKKFT